MGLDLYVGTLTRYFTQDWETIVQQVGREQGIPVEIYRPPPPPDAVTDPEEIRNGILDWKKDLAAAMREQAGADVDWSEAPSEPYFTDKPGWEGRAALCLLAAYSLFPSKPRPTAINDAWTDDPVFRAYRGNQGGRFARMFRRKLDPPTEGQLFLHITNLDMWTPGAFTGTIEVGGLGPAPLQIGSTSELLRQLELLNERTYRADLETMDGWLRDEPDGSFDQAARRGLAIFMDLARKAVEHRLPMKLDY